MHSTVKDQAQTRMDECRQAGVDLGLPRLDPAEYLVDIMFDLRPTRACGMGSGPTDWDIIAPYGDAIGLDPDDMQTLARMCRGYYDGTQSGENPLAIAPVDRKQT